MNDSPFEKLCKEPGKFNFFQGVRLFLRSADLLALSQVGKEEFERIRDYDRYLDVIKFKTESALSFPMAPIHKVNISLHYIEGKPFLRSAMHINFMGLTGPFGALPDYYSELVLQRMHFKDNTLKDFLDIFNHRNLSLFYKAWAKNKFYISYELNHALRNSEDKFSDSLRSVQGNGTSKVQNRLRTPDEVLLHYAGIFAQQPRSADLLEQLIGDYFSLSIKVLQFQPERICLAPAEYSRIGKETTFYNQLNINAVLGEKVWNLIGKFRLYISSLTYAQFHQLLPGQSCMLTLQELVRYYVGPQLNFDLQLELKKEEVPYPQLCGKIPLYLGWNTWLKSEEMVHDRDDTIFNSAA